MFKHKKENTETIANSAKYSNFSIIPAFTPTTIFTIRNYSLSWVSLGQENISSTYDSDVELESLFHVTGFC